jgi:hypothetical protein
LAGGYNGSGVIKKSFWPEVIEAKVVSIAIYIKVSDEHDEKAKDSI